MDYNEIHRIAVECKRPQLSNIEDNLAYFALYGLNKAYGERIITKSEASSYKVRFGYIIDDLKNQKNLSLEAYRAYQNNIKSASTRLSDLMKQVGPDADFQELFLSALGIIEQFEGMSENCIQKNAENRIKGKLPLSERTKADKSVTNTTVDAIIAPKNEVNAEKRKKFIKPTIEDIQIYCREANLNINIEQFYDYYESNGWKVGKNPMKDWRSAARNWNRRNHPQKAEAKTTSYDIDEFINRSIHGELKYERKKKAV